MNIISGGNVISQNSIKGKLSDNLASSKNDESEDFTYFKLQKNNRNF